MEAHSAPRTLSRDALPSRLIRPATAVDRWVVIAARDAATAQQSRRLSVGGAMWENFDAALRSRRSLERHARAAHPSTLGVIYAVPLAYLPSSRLEIGAAAVEAAQASSSSGARLRHAVPDGSRTRWWC